MEEEGEDEEGEEGEVDGEAVLSEVGSKVMASSDGIRRAIQGHQAWWLLMGSIRLCCSWEFDTSSR